MNLHKLILTQNDCYKTGKKITVKGIMVHSTGAPNTELRRYVGPDDGLLGKNQYNNHWNMGGLNVCVHAFIGTLKDGSVATYQTLPWNHRGWHAGSGSKGSANNTHISFEICEDSLKNATYFGKVYQEAVELCAYLCKEYNLDPMADGVLIDHSEGCKRGIASNHGDVKHWFPKFGKSMDTFRKDVNALVKAEKPKEEDPTARFSVSKWGVYTVTPQVGLWLRSGASTSEPTIELMKYGSKVICYGFYNGDWYMVASESGKVGFCHSDYLKKS